MKKLLALVLALVMTMSLVTISNAADFSDAKDIEHTEAVDVMNALGVIGGMPDGSFAPKGNVTRAQMAKMITIIMLGDVDAAAFIGTTTDLKDVNGHWAEGYIKYCYSQGVIAGKGNGVFAPDANVTAAEAAKMLLVAIGYDAAIQEYVGTDWAINVARDAQIKGLYAELKGLVSEKVLTRDEAAQMIWNAVQADGVEIRKGWNSEDNKITYSYADTDSLLKSTFKATEITGFLLDSELQTSGSYKGMYKVTLGSVAPAGAEDEYYVTDDYSELLAQKVSVMFFNKDKTGAYDAKDDTVFGVYADSKGIVSDVFAQSGVSVKADYKLKADGEVYTLDKDNGVWKVAVDGTISDLASNVMAKALKSLGSYNSIKLVDQDGDGKYDVAVVYEVKADKVTYVDSAKVIAGAKTYKFADYKIESGLAKNDYVALAYNFAEGCTELTKIEKLSGKVTGIDESNDKAEVNGAWIYDANNTNMSINNTYDYYVLNGVLVKASKTTGADLSTLVFVADTNSADFYKKARVYFTDGTNKTVKVDEESDDAATVVVGKLYVLAGETDKGYKFLEINDTNFPADCTDKDAVFNGYTYIAGVADDFNTTGSTDTGAVAKIGGAAVADDAVIFAYDTSMKTVKVITGEQLKSLSLAAASTNDNNVIDESYGLFTKEITGVTKVAAAAVQVEVKNDKWSDFNVSSAAAGYGLVISDVIKRDDYYEYTIWNGSENVAVKDETNHSLTKFSVIGYSKIDSDGYVTVEEYKAFANAQVTSATAAVAAGSLTGYEETDTGYDLTVSSVALTTDSKTVFMKINSSASASDEIGVAGASAEDLAVADKVYSQRPNNVIVYTNAAGNVARVVIIDVSNRLDLDAAYQVGVTAIATGLSVTDEEGNAVTTSSDLKAGDLLTVKNTTNTDITLATADGVKTLDGDPATGAYTAGSTTILVVTGSAAVKLAV